MPLQSPVTAGCTAAGAISAAPSPMEARVAARVRARRDNRARRAMAQAVTDEPLVHEPLEARAASQDS